MWDEVTEEYEGKFICVIGKTIVFHQEMETFRDVKKKQGETVIEYHDFPTGNLSARTDCDMWDLISPQGKCRFVHIPKSVEISGFEIKFDVYYDCVKFWGWVEHRSSQTIPTKLINLKPTKIELCEE